MKKPQIILMIAIIAVVITIIVSFVVYFENADDSKKSSTPTQTSSDEGDSPATVPETVATVSVVSNINVSSPEKTSITSITSSTSEFSKPAGSLKSSAKTSVSASSAMSSQTTPSVETSLAVSSTISQAPSSPASSEAGSYSSEVVRLINIERAKEGLNALTESPALNAAAKIRANEIITSFAHLRPDGQEWHTVLAENGIKCTAAGENIAAGQLTPADVVTAWINSPGHKTNIMNPSFTKMGVGYVTGGIYGYNWTQLFTN